MGEMGKVGKRKLALNIESREGGNPKENVIASEALDSFPTFQAETL